MVPCGFQGWKCLPIRSKSSRPCLEVTSHHVASHRSDQSIFLFPYPHPRLGPSRCRQCWTITLETGCTSSRGRGVQRLIQMKRKMSSRSHRRSHHQIRIVMTRPGATPRLGSEAKTTSTIGPSFCGESLDQAFC